VAIPWGNDPLVNLFADRKCRCDDKPLHQYVRRITKPLTAETALHELYEDKVQAAIVDGAALQAFAERYPARARLIRTLFESEPFPLSVLVYQEGAVDPAIIGRFRKCMAKARMSEMGRLLMTLMGCAGFEEIPPNFETELAQFVQHYPQREELGK
jgi:ABC-type phosphate/phosphonate transport system substrate-binding protein